MADDTVVVRVPKALVDEAKAGIELLWNRGGMYSMGATHCKECSERDEDHGPCRECEAADVSIRTLAGLVAGAIPIDLDTLIAAAVAKERERCLAIVRTYGAANVPSQQYAAHAIAERIAAPLAPGKEG